MDADPPPQRVKIARRITHLEGKPREAILADQAHKLSPGDAPVDSRLPRSYHEQTFPPDATGKNTKLQKLLAIGLDRVSRAE